jgi:hypothetical protein
MHCSSVIAKDMLYVEAVMQKPACMHFHSLTGRRIVISDHAQVAGTGNSVMWSNAVILLLRTVSYQYNAYHKF